MKLLKANESAFLVLASMLAVLFLSGCEGPRNRVVWSPDGQKMAVLAGDGLRLSGSSGSLTPPLLHDVELISWLPDSAHAAAVTTSKAETWKQILNVISAAESNQIVAQARTVLKDILSYKGDWEQFLKEDRLENLPFLPETFMYLRDHHREDLKKKLSEHWKDVENLSTTIYKLQLYDLSTTGAKEGPVLHRGLKKIVEARVSGLGKAVAFVESSATDGETAFRLLVVSANGGPARTVAPVVARSPDWTADGRSLVFVRPDNPASSSSNPSLAALLRVTVCDSTGEPKKEFDSGADLATLVYDHNNRVRCCEDGRILFSSAELTLPCSDRDTSRQKRLFAVEPGKQTTVIRLLPRLAQELIGNEPDYFEVSPDGKKVAIPSGSGSVSIFTISTGLVGNVQQKTDRAHNRLLFIPQWRSSDELCLAGPCEKEVSGKHRAEVMLWSLSKDSGIKLSQSWPAEAVDGFLEWSEPAKEESVK